MNTHDIELPHEVRKTAAQFAPDVDVLIEALEHIIDHWNGDQNDQAISDALWYIKTAQNALAAYRQGGGE